MRRNTDPLLTSALALLAIWLMTSPAWADIPIVYSRCKRTTTPLVVKANLSFGGVKKDVSITLDHTDIADRLPDVTLFRRKFLTPCDLIYRDAKGKEKVLYDCASQSTDKNTCSAMDAAVSFDAKTVVFTVFHGTVLRDGIAIHGKIFDGVDAKDRETLTRLTMPNKRIDTAYADIYKVDLTTGKLTQLTHNKGKEKPGAIDQSPTWLSNGRIAFISHRSYVFSTVVANSSRPSGQIFSMDPDGRNVEKASHHSLGSEQHPFQLMDGRLAFTSWQVFGMLPFRSGDGAGLGFVGTVDNFFHLYTQMPDGAHAFALFGQHLSTKWVGGKGEPEHFAAHFIGQSSDGRIWTADYYRGNNGGLGDVVGFVSPPDGQEGYGPDEKPKRADLYRPRKMTVLAGWATNKDTSSNQMPLPRTFTIPTYKTPLILAGKLSHPSGIPNNQLLVTWGVGACSTTTSIQPATRLLAPLGHEKKVVGGGRYWPAMKNHYLYKKYLGADNPGCDAGIYITTTIPSKHPSDLKVIVNKREYHEIMARPVVPYKDIYGIDKPKLIEDSVIKARTNPRFSPGTPFGILGAASVLLRETKNIRGHAFSPLSVGAFVLQGTDTIDYKDADICGIRILGVQPNQRYAYREFSSYTGERVMILGEFPVRHYDAKGKPIIDALKMHDTSFLVRFPANTPYIMQAIDCSGHALNTDQTWQSLKPAEVKTCGGCHVHGKPGLDFNTTTASAPGFKLVDLGRGSVPLLRGGSGTKVVTQRVKSWGLSYEFTRDIFPILQKRCMPCHSTTQADAGLILDKPGTEDGSTYDRLVHDRLQKYVPKDRRYIDAFTGRVGVRKPQLSRYLRAFTARGSLLYWKAQNKRMDGRTDAQYDKNSPKGWEDVDFGPSHPTNITPDERAILARWIETGAAGGKTKDTTHPVLTLMADVNNNAVRTLLVGTADAGSGIKPDSLVVCVVQPDSSCGPNLAQKASMAGVNRVALSAPLTDLETEIRATIKDQQGNTTSIQKTVRRLLAQGGAAPPPGPEPPTPEPPTSEPNNEPVSDPDQGAPQQDASNSTPEKPKSADKKQELDSTASPDTQVGFDESASVDTQLQEGGCGCSGGSFPFLSWTFVLFMFLATRRKKKHRL